MRFFAIAILMIAFLASMIENSVGQQPGQRGARAVIPVGKSSADGSVFENAVSALKKNFVHREFRDEKLPAIVKRYRDRAERAVTLKEQRQVVHDMLSEIPASHMGVLSKSTFDHLIGELMNKRQPTFGFELKELDGKHFSHGVLEGGPADKAGLRRGDRILLIDDTNVDSNTRLDWRSDDSFMVDPPIRMLGCQDGDTIKLLVERTWGKTIEISITAKLYSAFEAAKASSKIIEFEGKKFGYIHFWFIHVSGVDALLKENLEFDFANCDGLILDLRGRGGSAGAIQSIYDVLSGKSSDWDKPVVALFNHGSRSAKEVMSYELSKQKIALTVGERTAGAVIPATFVDLGSNTMLMYPTFNFGKYTSIIEGKGVAPDVYVKEAGPYSAGADPLVETGLRELHRLSKEAKVKL